MYKVLSLTGGGFFGLYTAHVIQHIEKKANKPIHKIFDCITGTSIGGIIAMLLASGYPSNEIVDIIIKQGPVIFKQHYAEQFINAIYHLLPFNSKVKYSNKNLEASLNDVFGKQAYFDDMLTTVIIPAYNVTRSKPHLFQTSGNKKKGVNLGLTKAQVAMCTSAAPPWFPLVKVNNQMFMDPAGYACSPDLLAFESLQHDLKIPMRHIKMLSIGSVTSQPNFTKSDDIQPQMLSWHHTKRLLLTQIASQQQVTINIMNRTLQNHYLRIDNVCHYEQQQLLGMDKTDKIAQKILQDLAQDSFTKIEHNSILNQLLSS